jgi:hypothetical protein
MPYIEQKHRETFMPDLLTPGTAGALNYQITMVIRNYIEIHGLSYQRVNDVIGALEGAKLEFYRRVVAPYEDRKITDNGDVYE